MRPIRLLWILMILGLTALSVAALLADLYELLPMSLFVPWITAPALAGLIALGIWIPDLELRHR